MTAYERILEDYARRPRPHPLAWYEERYKREGFLYVTPAFYIMGRPVRKYAEIEQITDDACMFDFETCDTWYIAEAAGEIRQAWRVLPWELPWICFQRNREQDLQFYETRRLMRLSGWQS